MSITSENQLIITKIIGKDDWIQTSDNFYSVEFSNFENSYVISAFLKDEDDSSALQSYRYLSIQYGNEKIVLKSPEKVAFKAVLIHLDCLYGVKIEESLIPKPTLAVKESKTSSNYRLYITSDGKIINMQKTAQAKVLTSNNTHNYYITVNKNEYLLAVYREIPKVLETDPQYYNLIIPDITTKELTTKNKIIISSLDKIEGLAFIIKSE